MSDKVAGELILRAMKMLPGAVVQCHNNCREYNCASCFGEDDAKAYLARVVDLYSDLQDYLAGK